MENKKNISVSSAANSEESPDNTEEKVDGSAAREEISHLKTKTIPAIVMLLGGLVTSITCFVRRYTVMMTLWRVLLALVVFLILGGIVKFILDKITLRKIVIVDQPEDEEKSAENGETGEEGNADGKVSEE